MFTLESSAGAFVFTDGNRRLRIAFVADSAARITFTEGRDFRTGPTAAVPTEPIPIPARLTQRENVFELAAAGLVVTVARETGALRYSRPDGKSLLREPNRGGKWLTPIKIHRNVFDPAAAMGPVQGIDGARASAEKFTTVFDRDAFEAKLEFSFSKDEALFGLGSHEEGHGNLRGKSRELYQQNLKAVVPHLVSTRGYGLFFDCGSLMTFRDDALGSYWWADAVDQVDYYFIAGERVGRVIAHYYRLTGLPPMLPKWAFGYIQSKERYVTAEEMVSVVREYRRRKVPLDVIVLDWKSWPNGGGWGQKSFDPARFPDPKGFTGELHRLGAKLMVSIWPIMTGDCPDQRELRDKGLMLGNQATYNAFLSEGRTCYWEQANRGLFAHGVDAWWCDCTEPFEADWSGAVKPEPHVRIGINAGETRKYIDPTLANAYSLFHSRGIYEGQRRAAPARRVLNLTRSSFAGQHRYGTVTWNGDICGTWEALRRCIPEGLNFCATGEPYWTVDIGGFFLAWRPEFWFWRGDYTEGCRGLAPMEAAQPDPADAGCGDRGFWELYVRWIQYGAFLPMFRTHGTDAAREIWRFGEEGTPFYDAIAKYIRLRYRLIPYLYSAAAGVARDGTPLIRAVALDHPDDPRTHELTDQFFFGPSLLVCPVTRPMYYASGSRPLSDVPKCRDVYLPAGSRWYDFWSEAVFAGGGTATVDAPLETLPLFVREGSIVPLGEVMQHIEEDPGAPYEVRVYTGADASFTLYEDAGDGYDYEDGAFAEVSLTWRESSRRLEISARRGAFPGMVLSRDYRIVFVSARGRIERTIRYAGAPATATPG